MACAEPRLTALKVAFKGEIHRLRVDLSAFQFHDLSALFAETFTLSPGSFVIQYVDPEGDVLNVTSDAEYVEACSVFLSSADAVKSLRFNAVSRTQVAFQENVAEPILKAIEKLVQTLTAAMEKVKQDQWAQRAQTGVNHTGEALNRAAKDARESLYAAGKSIQEIPFDQVLKETSDGLKTAAEGITCFAHELVDEIKKLQTTIHSNNRSESEASSETSTPAEPAEEVVAPVQPTEAEWEQVEELPAVVEEAQLEETPVVVEVVTPSISPEELKWSTEIAMINDILPGVDKQRVIDHLEQCNGNIEVVVNALMG